MAGGEIICGTIEAADKSGSALGGVLDQLEAVVRSALGTKRDAHGFNIDGSGGPAKAMVSIGG